MREISREVGFSGRSSSIRRIFVGACLAGLGLAGSTGAADAEMGTLGAGAVWLEFKNHEPDFTLTRTTLGRLPLAPSRSFVVVGSTQPFTDWDWTIVTKLAVTLVFKK